MIALTPTLITTAFVVFCRIGGCLLIVPGFSSPRVPVQARLFVAIAVSLALTPLFVSDVEPVVAKAAPTALMFVILSESLKGVLIGLLGRFFFVALDTMTTAISYSIGLSSVFMSASEEEQQPSIVSLVSLGATLLIFATDLHWEVFKGLAASYNVLPIKASFDPRIGLTQAVDQAARTFTFTLRIASPFLVFSIIANFAIGLVNKLVPQIPVTFISAPFLVAGGLLIFYFTARPALDLFITSFGAFLRSG